jgi:hypothetical protein
MEAIYLRLMTECRRIAARYKTPEFYRLFQPALATSRRLFFHHPLVAHCRELVRPYLLDDFGHGLHHASKVGLDAGAIVLVEGEKYVPVPGELERAVVLVQLAGLLHDIKRAEANHALAGAEAARRILRDFPLTGTEVAAVSDAIASHEAFSESPVYDTVTAQLVVNALYDADKFRWGPDNFTHTVWFMVSYQKLPIEEVVGKFPWGVSGIQRIKETFRTTVGRQYGPEFIDLGVQIGKEIFQYLQRHLNDLKGEGESSPIEVLSPEIGSEEE